MPIKKEHFPSEEYKLLNSLKPYLNYKKTPRHPIAIGDDAAVRVCKDKETLIYTADSFVQDVHFSFDYMTNAEIGYKAMAINLSDCASMGAVPDGALIQMIFPSNIDKKEHKRVMQGMYAGFYKACKQFDFPILGGNLASGPAWIIDITMIGRMDYGHSVLHRIGAKHGDGLWVTGSPGESGAGLACLQKWKTVLKVPSTFKSLAKKHIAPVPRIEIGRDLSKNPLVHGAIDVSDGVSKECFTLSYDNNLGIMIDFISIPVPKKLGDLGKELHADWKDWYLHGGEDYELLFAADKNFDPAALIAKYGVPITNIGMFTKSIDGVMLIDDNGRMGRLEKNAWDHLKFKKALR